jgi:predicted membrane chloride channel (bestrophin family)
MSDEPTRVEEKRPVPWAAAVLLVTVILSYCGMFAFLLLSDHTSPLVPVLWVLATAMGFRLGMRALKKRYENPLPR